jgi:hypothetical protein
MELKSKNLDELLQNLREIADADGTRDWAENAGIDLTSLPTFGGDEPDDTGGVWSWDENRLLVGDGSFEDWEIVSRD